tara:strand:+ start:184 stop:552 length:369 start_codon:yes stop_codon:yes gene_type:complete
MAIIEGYARPAPVDAQTIPISTVITDYAPEVKPGKPDMGLDPDYTPPSTFDFGTVTEKPSGQVKPGKPDMGLMPDEQIEERAEPMDVTGDIDTPIRKLTQDQKYALVGLLVMGLLATYYKRR